MTDSCLNTFPSGTCLPDGLEMTDKRLTTNLIFVGVGFFWFASNFLLAHHKPFNLFPGMGLVQKLYPEHYAKMDDAGKADIASRLHSSTHAIVVFGHFWAFTQCDIWGKSLANTCKENEIFFSITVGYFLFDFFVVLYYRMAFWQVFVVHHCAAISPYFIQTFVPGCSHAHFILGLFIQVEFATLMLNYQNLLEVTERSHTLRYKIVFYSCYVVWIAVRIALPLYIVIVVVQELMPYYGGVAYAVVSYACGFFVMLFCTIVWLAILTPDVIAHLRGPPSEDKLDQDAEAQAETAAATAVAPRRSSRWSRTSGTALVALPLKQKPAGPDDASKPVVGFRSRGSSIFA